MPKPTVWRDLCQIGEHDLCARAHNLSTEHLECSCPCHTAPPPPARFIVSGAAGMIRRGTVRTRHMAAGPTGTATLCGRPVKDARVLTGFDAQHLTCAHCARIAARAH